MAKINAPRSHIKAVKAKSKTSKTGALTKELMNKAVRHIAEEIVAAKPGLDGCTPRGFAEKLVKEGKETFPKITMNKVNYAINLIKDELKKGSLSLNASNVSSLTDDNSVVSTASTNVTSGTSSTSSSKSSMESEISNPTKKRQATCNNSSQKRSKLKTSAVDKGSEKKKQPKKKSPISSKNTVLTQMQLANQKDLQMKLPESFPNLSRRQHKKQCVSFMK